MTTKERIKDYQDILTLMAKDAVEDKDRAAENLREKEDLRLKAINELTTLQNTMQKNIVNLRSAIKVLIRMLWKKPEDPAELECVLQPANAYLEALKAIPKTEKRCDDARKQVIKAREEVAKADNLFHSIVAVQALYSKK